MTTIRVGIHNNPPGFYVTSPNTLGGFLAPFAIETVMNVLNKVNITFVSIKNANSTACSSDGLCTTTLGYLQNGLVDFVSPTSYAQLESIGINLTTTTSLWEGQCYLTYKKKLSPSLHYSSFSGLILSFDQYFWLILSFLLPGFSVILCSLIKHQQPSMDIIDIYWNLFGYLLGQNYNTVWSILNRLPLILMILPLIFSGKLLSSSLKTGLVSNQDYVKIETLSDLIKHDYQAIIHENSNCRHKLKDGTDLLSRQVASRSITYSLVGKSINEIYSYSRQDKKATILSKVAFIAYKSIGCLTARKEEEAEPYEISENSLFKDSTGYFMNTRSSPEIQAIIMRRTYSAYEGVLITNRYVLKSFLNCYGLSDISTACTEGKVENKVVFIPISSIYLQTPFMILIFGYAIALVIVTIERIIGNNDQLIERYFY